MSDTSSRAFVVGCEGAHLNADEIKFFGNMRPWGLILFRRNIVEPSQVKALISEFRDAVGRPDAPVLVDQEGGRVQRLGPPHWRRYPSGARFMEVSKGDVNAAAELARLSARLIAHDLFDVGISIDCAPVLDLPVDGMTDAIGDRAYARDPMTIAKIGRAFADGLIAGGILPVIKHMPGHGRAMVDSHKDLPLVQTPKDILSKTDFVPFRRLADLPIAMTAHIVFHDIDPDNPATASRHLIQTIIRSEIGFGGLLLSDDMSMEALKGDFGSRARAIFEAGCDMAVHCNGRIEEARAVAAATPYLAGVSLERANRVISMLNKAPEAFDPVDAAAKLDAALALPS